jgi:predicted AAA+ superfamily ATPase
LNVAGLARDAQVARSTVTGYVSVLEDTHLAFLLSPHEAKLRVKERKHPKLYWCDPGLVRAIKRQFSRPTAEERGPLLEGWVAELLRSYRDYREIFEDWFYWAPGEARETEVDFLLRRGREFAAIEVKSGLNFTGSATRGLRAIAELKGLIRRILVYGGHRRLELEDGITVLPVADFVEWVETGRLFP